jgi:hypothetical protein
MNDYDTDAPPILTPPRPTKTRLMTLTFDQIDAFLRAALFAVDAGYPDATEVAEVVADLRERHVPRGLVVQFRKREAI